MPPIAILAIVILAIALLARYARSLARKAGVPAGAVAVALGLAIG
jgi:hypothetical protein